MLNSKIYQFHLLAKPTGAICNLDCKYCFFLSKEELYPDSDFRMREDVLEQYIKQLLQAHKHASYYCLARRRTHPHGAGFL